MSLARARRRAVLTPQQHTVLLGCARGEQPATTAARLGIGVRDVRLHLRAVLVVLKAENAAHAVGLACALSLITPADILQEESPC
ncbi:LuxR C-terminal-related transcriptional regulator [Kitasatospora sp. NPDC094028]